MFFVTDDFQDVSEEILNTEITRLNKSSQK